MPYTFVGRLYVWKVNMLISITERNDQYVSALSRKNRTDREQPVA